MHKIILEIHRELRRHIDPVYRAGSLNFFKEEITVLGVRAPFVRRIAAEFWGQARELSKAEIFALVEELLQDGRNESEWIAFNWLYRLKKDYEPRDFSFFEKCLKKYVANWASCDTFCTHALGYLLNKYPEFLPRLKVWSVSKNRWLRRAAAVSLIYPLAHGKYLKQAFEIADMLLLDEDDLVQKGYGWMLKVGTAKFQREVFDYVMKHKAKMPRTALRYAIEKLPVTLKKQAMAK